MVRITPPPQKSLKVTLSNASEPWSPEAADRKRRPRISRDLREQSTHATPETKMSPPAQHCSQLNMTCSSIPQPGPASSPVPASTPTSRKQPERAPRSREQSIAALEKRFQQLRATLDRLSYLADQRVLPTCAFARKPPDARVFAHATTNPRAILKDNMAPLRTQVDDVCALVLAQMCESSTSQGGGSSTALQESSLTVPQVEVSPVSRHSHFLTSLAEATSLYRVEIETQVGQFRASCDALERAMATMHQHDGRNSEVRNRLAAMAGAAESLSGDVGQYEKALWTLRTMRGLAAADNLETSKL